MSCLCNKNAYAWIKRISPTWKSNLERFKHWQEAADKCEVLPDAFVIFLRYDFQDILLRWMRSTDQNIEQQLRFNVLFATCLVHELCHAVGRWYSYQTKLNSWTLEQAQMEQNLNTLQFQEPSTHSVICKLHDDGLEEETLYLDCPWRENGKSWESEVFGGTVECIGHEIDCTYGLGFWPLPGTEEDTGKLIPQRIDWIQRIQLEEFWHQCNHKCSRG